ncbi:MAG: ribonuclease D [Alphaproteobacteria bacterium]|nr:ribonuclease D [Alphaproteobacteria bacterium]
MFSETVAIDTEAMGLVHARDRLCVVQLYSGRKGDPVHLVRIENTPNPKAPQLVKVLTNPDILKIFHFARFDVSLLMHTFNISVPSVFCTKIASFLCRTYTQKHGLKDLCKELLDVDLSKEEQTSDWGAAILSQTQKQYAAQDVLYLHQLRHILIEKLMRENRLNLAQSCFDFLETRVRLDHLAGADFDIFSHKFI